MTDDFGANCDYATGPLPPEQPKPHPAIRAWRDAIHLGRTWATLHDRGNELSQELEKALTALEAAEKALWRLANPKHQPKTEEAVLLQAEVEKIARDALERR